jgi:nucleotide-binding universal stress UspA family protein
METTPITPGSVVVGVDGTEQALRAVDWAAEQASLEGRPLVVVHVVSDTELQATAWAGVTWVVTSTVEEVMAVARNLTDQAAARARSHHPDLVVECHTARADVRRELLELSTSAAMLVLGSRGRGTVSSALLGSVGAHLARYAGCPLVICRPGHPGRVRDGVVVAADGTPGSLPVLEHAFRQASLRRLPLTVVHCLGVADDQAEERRVLAESLAGFGEKFPDVHVETRLEAGLVEDVLTGRGGRTHDLVVVGRHPVDTLGRRMSHPNATAVLEHTDATVAVVPQAHA